ncbi:MAG: ubiquinol-cytochrome c reductase [Gemmatales bacterium]|nr:MAG: ubiquinol-cytochrome c reductase [Gemmatales bacterium]
MANWLFKEEPDHYSFDDLLRDRTTLWDGVTNNLARLHLRNVKKGDRILFYHTGKEKAIVGEMRAISGPMPDPNLDDDKAVVVKVKPVKKWSRPVTLKEIKARPEFADWELLRISRLSVMPVSEEHWNLLEQMRDQG